MMKQLKQPTPPRWAERFLSWYCKPSFLEDLQGDLNEYFYRNVQSKGVRQAKWIYILDVIKFIRPYTVRKPQFFDFIIHTIMLSSYLKTSGRTLVRNKLFSTINIVGLAISMSVGLLLIAMLSDIFSYDKFHEHHDRIYRVISRYEYLNNKDNNFMATTSLRAANAIRETFTGHDDVAILQRGFEGDVKYEEKELRLRGFWANTSLLNVFSFSLVQGDPATALTEPFSVILTETSAKKIWGHTDALGKTLILDDDKAYTVTGVIKDIPTFSHMNFEMLGSLSTYELLTKDNDRVLAWDNMWNTWVYVLMKSDTDIQSYQQYLNELSLAEDKTVKNTHIEMILQPLDEIVSGDNLGNQIGNTIGRTMILVFSGLAFIVVLSACFNYTNLSVARSLRRSREVGIRKVIGAAKGHVMGQFIVEAIIIALLSLIAAIGLFLLVRPYFLNMHSDLKEMLMLELSPEVIMYFVAFAVLTGIAAGFFPAILFSRINVIQVLKQASGMRMFRRVTMRKALIVFQYCLSIMLITSTAIIYKQYDYFLSYDLGFSTDHILNVRLQGNKPDILKEKLLEMPEVATISESSMVTSIGEYNGTSVKNPEHPEDSGYVYFVSIDERYLPLHQHHLLAGSNFTSRTPGSAEHEVIVNQQVLKRFDIADQVPSQAIGQVLRVDGKELTIIGVVKDFQYGTVNNVTPNEVLFRNMAGAHHFLNVKLQSENRQEVLSKVEAAWKQIDPVHPFSAYFYDDQIKEAYKGMSASAKLTGYIAFLAICIASLGLLGMVVFTTETRIREISIRKVLGASEVKLMFLLSRGFILMLLLATLIALPLTYLFFERIMFPNIGHHAPIGFTTEMVGVFAVMLIALLMISSQTLKVARANPADVLKAE